MRVLYKIARISIFIKQKPVRTITCSFSFINFLSKNLSKLPVLLILFFSSNQLLAQKDSVEKIFAFKITDYIKLLTDSSSAVQVFKPAVLPVAISDKQLGVLYHAYKSGTKLDTAMIGWGRCNLIKGAYYYFGIRLKKISNHQKEI